MMLLMNTETLVFVFTEEMQHLYKVVLLAEVNYACRMWALCHFGKHLKFSMMRCTKFLLIDIEVGILPTVLQVWRRMYMIRVAEDTCCWYRHILIHSYQQHVSVLKYPFNLSDTKLVGFAGNPHQISLGMWKRTPYLVRNCHFPVKTVSSNFIGYVETNILSCKKLPFSGENGVM